MYIGHQSTEDPRKFLFYEQYKDAAALDAHRSAPYFKQYVTGGLDAIMEQRSRDLYLHRLAGRAFQSTSAVPSLC